ncbi:MAG: FecCD family ABC transporter permease [Bacillota bacterium]|uniref:Iron ABC transporter permease n=1 Tax=Virgibacillus salarius TaxID=447199 RepID=A0A941IAK8_9BACI|nr:MULTISPECIES: iron ABC transporter permease [Bacillaceae]NAZ09513.1 iron chelate uptake ABC transporter family permease subunit [Agaribacter marinus]MBR7796803.1 iron ABC transporter permease [Virgibacillus salarius]MCC2250138.1 iron ABC transporter permease [Virgibacillus sp. AGTR]MDY7045607.1 iron ABC transporter permease [Virgibacillus sp. M23]QRZ19020.1 iron ABC transporter permease [Virgibacillus sp. AGTR]
MAAESRTSDLHTTTKSIKSRPLPAMIILIGGIIATIFALTLSISIGAADITFSTVWEAIFHYDPTSTSHSIIQELRLPRTLAGVLVGASFAVAGAMMQGMTRNPLADPGILGINAGAVFMVAICFALFPGMSYNGLILFSFIGAGVSVVLVFGISSMGKGVVTPVKIVLAGAAVTAFFTALSEGIGIYFSLSQDLAFWFAGGIAGVKWTQLKLMFPWVLGALIAAMLLSKSITILSLGDDVAKGLGQRTKLVRAAGFIIVLLIAGVAVAVAGPIGFVGLIVPHIARFFVGVDYRLIIPCSAVIGGFLTCIADIGARMINAPQETPIGALFALIGVPFFLYVARKERRNL